MDICDTAWQIGKGFEKLMLRKMFRAKDFENIFRGFMLTKWSSNF